MEGFVVWSVSGVDIMKPVDKSIIIVAILGLVILECFAMHYGINGTFRTMIFTAIAALAGLSVDTTKYLK